MDSISHLKGGFSLVLQGRRKTGAQSQISCIPAVGIIGTAIEGQAGVRPVFYSAQNQRSTTDRTDG